MTNATLPAPVKGYTEQTVETVALVNENKILEEMALRQLDRLSDMPDVDPRFCAMARSHFQEGFMAMNRAVFKPERIQGDLSEAALPLSAFLSGVFPK